MPKEIIQFANTTHPDPTSVELVWSKSGGGGNLQLHFQRHNFARTIDPDGVTTLDQYTDQLSRDDCNRLIRALRRARDQVYGPDA
jgi:hypothetical protein